jgi:outer membrane receptor protein involved in Fe transport
MRKAFRFTWLAVLAFALAAPALIFAQGSQTGNLGGQVKDESGGVLPGVSIEATSQERNTVRTATTDAQGRYLFAAMPLGRYRVKAMLSGFETVTRTDNLVEAEKTTEVPISLRLAGEAAEITVTGEVPIVDKTNTTAAAKVTEEQFEKIPVGRSYQTVLGRSAGVIGTGNVNANGALTSNNQFLIDGVDTTDPTTGTFGGNLNFDAIQEVNVFTSGVSAEYGRNQGAIVNVITKSGTNTFEGSAKYIVTNDDWNEQNKTHNEVTGASNERVKVDQNNEVWSYTLGGPLWRDHIWFFGAYETSELSSTPRQTVDVPENFVQTTESPWWDGRITGQVTPSHTIWAKYYESPTDGFVIDYWSGSQIPIVAGELEALTRQDQTAESWAVNWTGVFGNNFTMEALYSDFFNEISVVPYQSGPTDNGSPIHDNSSGFYYNGATFDGIVKRPRDQFLLAGTLYTMLGGNSHSFKAGFDWQGLESTASFAYPNNRVYEANGFDPVTRTIDHDIRNDFDPPAPSTSQGDVYAFFLRDKFEVGKRLFFEVGLRYEKQEGDSDVGNTTVDTDSISPRLAGSYDVAGNGKSIISATYGRFSQYLIQGFSDSFAQVPQQGNYDVYEWDGTQYVFSGRVETGGSSLTPNTNLDASYLDEFTIAYSQQIGNTIGVGIRGIYRTWNDLIDDVVSFDSDGLLIREYTNYGPAERDHTALQLTFEKRFSNNWYAQANYTWSETEGNHFANTASQLGDYLQSDCRTTIDPSIGNNGVIPCREAVEGPNATGLAAYDRPHNFKLFGAYVLPIGSLVDLTFGTNFDYISGINYRKNRAVTALNPVTGAAVANVTYNYEPLGSDELDAYFSWDLSLEAVFNVWKSVQLGVKGEVFNVTDEQEKITVNNTQWCDAQPGSASCQTARNNYGTATARGSFQAPRNYRLTALVRF